MNWLEKIASADPNNPLTPQMIKQVIAIVSFPTEAYAAKLLWDHGVRKEHLAPYMSQHFILGNVYNILADAERGYVHPITTMTGGGASGVPIEKLPNISQLQLGKGKKNVKDNKPKTMVTPGT